MTLAAILVCYSPSLPLTLPSVGIYVKPGRDRDALAAMLQREGYVPVWLESGLLDLYYNGFCNSVLWQLFHYVPLQLDGWQRVQEHQTLQMQWGAYQQVRQVAWVSITWNLQISRVLDKRMSLEVQSAMTCAQRQVSHVIGLCCLVHRHCHDVTMHRAIGCTMQWNAG